MESTCLYMGHFKALGHRVQRQKFGESTKNVDMIGLQHQRTQRRITYRIDNAPNPHYIWHIDGNYKLNRLRLFDQRAIATKWPTVCTRSKKQKQLIDIISEGLTKELGMIDFWI